MSLTQTALDALTEWQISRSTGNADLEHEKATAMLKAVKQALTANTWRDISECPIDTHILIFDEDHFEVVRKIDNGVNIIWADYRGVRPFLRPTHWQPLPPKPEQPPC